MASHLRSGLELLLVFALALIATDSNAAISTSGLMDQVLLKYAAVTTTWKTVIAGYATWLFWVLALLSMVWTFGLMALRQADASEFFAEFVKFTVFTGFYWWLLSNGPEIAVAIMDSLRVIGGKASGAGKELSPSGIVDVGFELFGTVADKTFIADPVDSVICILLAAAILVILALISVNMLLLLISSWILAYAGIFFLGFGGSRWTSEMALSYFRTVLSIGAQLFAMVLLVGIGKSFLMTYFEKIDDYGVNELAVILVVSVILLVLVNKVPGLIGGLAMGGGTGALGAGLGAGAVIAGAAMAASAAASIGKSLAGAAANIAGGAQAVMEAMSQAGQSDAYGGGGSQDFLSGQNNDGAKEGGGGESTFAQAMGNDNSSSTSTSSARSEQGTNATSSGQSSSQPNKALQSGKSTDKGSSTMGKLAQGIKQVAKESMNQRISNTVGGRIAKAIRENDSSQAGSGGGANTLSAGKSKEFDPQAEVAAFADKNNGDDDGSKPPEA